MCKRLLIGLLALKVSAHDITFVSLEPLPVTPPDRQQMKCALTAQHFAAGTMTARLEISLDRGVTWHPVVSGTIYDDTVSFHWLEPVPYDRQMRLYRVAVDK